MGILSFIGRRLYEVVALGRAVGNLAVGIGKKVVSGVKYVGKAVYDIFKAKPKGVIKETIKEVGTGTKNTGRGILKQSVPKTTISAPPIKGPQLTPPTAGNPALNTQAVQTIRPLARPFANPTAGMRNIIEDGGYYYGSPQPARLFKGALLPSDIPAGARSFPLGAVTQRNLGGLTKQQRIAQEVGGLRNLII